ncbi:MAG: two-component system response regulator [Desulfobulbaceae bacterium]|nr:MAG: two-component system response regulator [Desulfobulbaceae bacterium]
MQRGWIDLSRVQSRVLLVDDDPEMLALLELQLGNLGLKADPVRSGKAAADLLAERPYELVITDVEMPDMDGMRLLRYIKEALPGTDVLVFSGYCERYSFSDFIAAGAADFLNKPFTIDELAAKVQRLFRERRLINDLARIKEKEKSFFIHIVESLAISLDEKDRYTHGHSRRVTNLALQLAQQVDADIDFDLLRIGGILHDIGKIGVPDNILSSPGRLSVAEFEIIKRHPVQGAHILKPMEADARIAKISEIIMHHHEHYDGSGYPCGLKGGDIPLTARIVAIADSYDAMTSDRPYRQGLDVESAIRELEAGAGSQFDPGLVARFVAMMSECRQGGTCPRMARCLPIFIKTKDKASFYKERYCVANYKVCARYQVDRAGNMPADLSPDGNFFQERYADTECI